MSVTPSTPESVLATIEAARLAGESRVAGESRRAAGAGAGAPDRAGEPRLPRLEPSVVTRVEPVDLRRAVEKALTVARPDVALDTLEASGVLAAFLPEVTELVGFGDGE